MWGKVLTRSCRQSKIDVNSDACQPVAPAPPAHAAASACKDPATYTPHTLPYPKETAMSHQPARLSRRRFLTTAAQAAGLVALPSFHSRQGAWQRRGCAAQRTDHRRRHRHRQSRQLRPGLLPATARRPLRGRLRREGQAARRRSRRRSTRSTATRSAPRTATSASCWPATTSTPC